MSLKDLTLKIFMFLAFFTMTVMAAFKIAQWIQIGQGKEILEQDAHILSSILEEENCLSNDVINGESRYMNFVNNTLRNSETDIFKYDISVGSDGSVRENPELLGDSWSGIDDDSNPLKVSYVSYVTCLQRDSIVTATLTMRVYTPTLFSAFVEMDDPFAAKYHRMRYDISQPVEVIGTKFYKGKD